MSIAPDQTNRRLEHKWILVCLIALPLLAILNVLLSRPDTDRFKRAMGSPDQLYGVMREYGRPDIDKTTEHNVPRPPIVTRYIEYADVDLRLVFVPDAKLGGAPPYRDWKFAGSNVISSERALTPHELETRLNKLPQVDQHPRNILSQVW